jgi:hypothetical protein
VTLLVALIILFAVLVFPAWIVKLDPPAAGDPFDGEA